MSFYGRQAGDTLVEECAECGEDFDYLIGSGQSKVCEECIEAQCVKCGGEGGQRLAGDETFWQCSDCKFIDMEK